MNPYSDDLPDFVEENANFGHLKTFGVKRELRFLSTILTDNENVLVLTRGWVDSRCWLMAITDLRVVLIHCGLLYGRKYLEIPIV
ncbi:MAG: PH domain-containing protein, partial [Deltaproteobacteria bacterium]|nr:PH domain-containing protein [Deltaproteobacteria bacterium]